MHNPHRAMEQESRNCQRCGMQFEWLNFIINAALAVLKGLIGVVASSRALLACALYSINDVLSAVIAMVSLKIARRPPDQHHAYGYGKVEFISIGIVSSILVAAVVFILFFSVVDIVRGIDTPPHVIAVLTAAVTMVTNEFLARRGFCAAFRMGSPIIHTSAEHNRADAISSLATVVGVGGAALGLHLLDPLVAIFETIHIIWLSGSLFGYSLRGLMDSALPEADVARVNAACRQVQGVREVVQLRSRQAGPHSWLDIEIAVPRESSVTEAEKIARQVRHTIQSTLGRSAAAQVKISTGPKPLSLLQTGRAADECA